ncbi:serine-rich adhesin for platelets-like [Argopecten irradians]|uniref:serine-rich adhesin for platelets-like n=1 Tax=Argopecten irradians TaxID=31199 RepID=UPI003715EC9C
MDTSDSEMDSDMVMDDSNLVDIDEKDFTNPLEISGLSEILLSIDKMTEECDPDFLEGINLDTEHYPVIPIIQHFTVPSVVPATYSSCDVPALDSPSDVPAIDSPCVVSTTESPSVVPAIDSPCVVSTTGSPSVVPAIDSPCVVSATESPSVVQATDSSCVVPPTNSLSVVPATDSLSVVPATDSFSVVPATDSLSVVPATNSLSVVPATDSLSVAPATDSLSVAPATDSPSVVPATDSLSVVPATDSSCVVPPTDSLSVVPATDSPSVVPATDSLSVVPATDSLSVVPATDSLSVVPATNSLGVVPATDSPSVVPATDSPSVVPATDSLSVVPATDSSVLSQQQIPPVLFQQQIPSVLFQQQTPPVLFQQQTPLMLSQQQTLPLHLNQQLLMRIQLQLPDLWRYNDAEGTPASRCCAFQSDCSYVSYVDIYPVSTHTSSIMAGKQRERKTNFTPQENSLISSRATEMLDIVRDSHSTELTNSMKQDFWKKLQRSAVHSNQTAAMSAMLTFTQCCAFQSDCSYVSYVDIYPVSTHTSSIMAGKQRERKANFTPQENSLISSRATEMLDIVRDSHSTELTNSMKQDFWKKLQRSAVHSNQTAAMSAMLTFTQGDTMMQKELQQCCAFQSDCSYVSYVDIYPGRYNDAEGTPAMSTHTSSIMAGKQRERKANFTPQENSLISSRATEMLDIVRDSHSTELTNSMKQDFWKKLQRR